MEFYSTYIDFLRDGAGAVIALAGWSLVALAIVWISGVWLALLISRTASFPGSPGEDPGRSFNDWTWYHPVAIATGLATQVSAWTASLYLTGGFLAGTLALLCPIFFGGYLWWRFRPRVDFANPALFVSTGVFAFLMGLWQHALAGLRVGRGFEQIAFSDLHRDIAFHVNLAGLIREVGLPPINMWASPTYDFNTLGHTGHAVLIAGYAQLLRAPLYEASTIVWIVATVLIGWGSLALVSTQNSGFTFKLLAAIGTLVWGHFALTDMGWLNDPGNALSVETAGAWIASRSYWSLSQALSIALTLGGLLVLARFCVIRRVGRSSALVLGASVALIAIGGWTKPSLVIFYGPALVIWLAFSGARAVEYAVTVLILAASFLIYSLPNILQELPPHPGWSFAMDADQWLGVATFLWHAGLSLIIATLTLATRWAVGGWQCRRWELLDLGVVAFGGSILFALFFREDRFVGFFVLQPNIWWGLSACIVLLVPLLSREVIKPFQQGGWFRWATMVALAVAVVQLTNGLIVAVSYPVMNLRTHDAIKAEALDAARRMTDPQTRFAIDHSLNDMDLRPYLSRPSIFGSSFTSADDERAYQEWLYYSTLGRGAPPIDRLDAVVTHKDRVHVVGYFAARGWWSTPLNELYTLWLKNEPSDHSN